MFEKISFLKEIPFEEMNKEKIFQEDNLNPKGYKASGLDPNSIIKQRHGITNEK